jgi:hypothetical protein
MLVFLGGRKDALPKPAKFDPDKMQGRDVADQVWTGKPAPFRFRMVKMRIADSREPETPPKNLPVL